jgi:8-oxo-dGTP pyrophosphatase MutT (NUDIX family)
MQIKVLAYITRAQQNETQLLVFTHRDHPDAGLQIPAGTVEESEEIEHALFREIQEESGLTRSDLKLIRKLAEHPQPEWNNIRHVFHLAALKPLPDSWNWLTNDYDNDEARARDERLVFCYRWESLKNNIDLAGNQGMWLDNIR